MKNDSNWYLHVSGDILTKAEFKTGLKSKLK